MDNGNVNNDNVDNDNNNARCVRPENKEIFGFNNLYKSYLACRKNKRNTINALKFEENLEENLFCLEKELKSRTYKPNRSVCFVVLKPKPREIFAADFRDRIVHHLLVKQLDSVFERKFIYDSYACRIGKGTHKAVKRLQKFVLGISQNNSQRVYYLQLDIYNFFMSIDKDILFDLIKNRIEEEDVLWLSKIIIYHEPQNDYIQKSSVQLRGKVPFHKSLLNTEKDKGLPIGNHSSQFFANIYLNELDQFVKHKLKVKFYVRYVDDFIVLGKTKEELIETKEEIENFLFKCLRLKLNAKQKILPVSNGINFLGYIVRAKYILVRRRVIHNFKEKLGYFDKLINKNENLMNSLEFSHKIMATTSSYFGHFKHADSFNLKMRFVRELEDLRGWCGIFLD